MSSTRTVQFKLNTGATMSGTSATSRKSTPSSKPSIRKSSPPSATKRSTGKSSPTLHRQGTGGLDSPLSSAKPVKKASPSPSRTATAQRSRGKLAKDGSAEEDKKERRAEVTESGLKIVDCSGQGLTNIPYSIITAKDVGHLIVASNNLRSLPADIRRLKSLEKLDLSKNGIRCNSSNDFSGLPPEMASLTQLMELNVSECNLPYVPPAIFKMISLKILNLSRNKVNIVPPEIGQLINLVKLNLQQTNITSLPPDIAFCQELEEIYLCGNSIETLPETLSEMPKLRVLALNYRSFSGMVDPYMANLLKKGQIKSEHIPMVVFELPALEFLDLESTNLNTLPDIYNTQLRELCLCKNFLQIIPPSIYNLQQLRILDVSYNLLTHLPEDIGCLKGLKVLRLAGNSLGCIPPTLGLLRELVELNMAQNQIQCLPPEIKGLSSLQILILERNNIQFLPDEICELTQLHTLDLTSNQIHTLPMGLHHLKHLTEAHTFHKLEKCGLWLYKNPLEQPPPEVWHTQKPRNIFEYLRKLVIVKTENLQRQKIQLIGESQSGKTSLVNALFLRKSFLASEPQDKTRLLKQSAWKTENKVEFVLNDFGGDNAYRMLYKLFFDSKALVILVYNAGTFCEEHFHNVIGQWLDMLSASIPGAVVKIVGTHADLLHPASTDPTSLAVVDESNRPNTDAQHETVILGNTCKPLMVQLSHNEIVHNLVTRYLKTKEIKYKAELDLLKSNIAKIEKSGNKELSLMEEAALNQMHVREHKLNGILQNPLRVLPKVSTVSSADSLEGILPLTDELEHLAIDLILFPHAQRSIPGHWNQLKSMLKQRQGFFLHWADIQKIAQLFNIQEAELKECIKYLHDIADVIWFHDNKGLHEIVFHKPKTLVEIIGSLFRHDMTDFLQYDNKVFLSKGRMNQEQFQESSNIFLQNGEISRPLLNCLWFHFNFKNQDLTELLQLLPRLEICYSVPEPDIPTGPLHTRPLIVLPHYNKYTDLTLLADVWPDKMEKKDKKELSVVYTFPGYCPPEIFTSISIQIHELVDERIDWQDCIYAKSKIEELLLHHSVQGDTTKLSVSVRGPAFSTAQCFMEKIVDLVNTWLFKHSGLYWKLTITTNRQKR